MKGGRYTLLSLFLILLPFDKSFAQEDEATIDVIWDFGVGFNSRIEDYHASFNFTLLYAHTLENRFGIGFGSQVNSTFIPVGNQLDYLDIPSTAIYGLYSRHLMVSDYSSFYLKGLFGLSINRPMEESNIVLFKLKNHMMGEINLGFEFLLLKSYFRLEYGYYFSGAKGYISNESLVNTNIVSDLKFNLNFNYSLFRIGYVYKI